MRLPKAKQVVATTSLHLWLLFCTVKEKDSTPTALNLLSPARSSMYVYASDQKEAESDKENE